MLIFVLYTKVYLFIQQIFIDDLRLEADDKFCFVFMEPKLDIS